MSLSVDLLLQAHHLASLDRGRPRQANLRRAISSAYYSLFHLLVDKSVRRIAPPAPAKLAPRIARAYAHDEMRQVCKSITERNPSPILIELQPAGFSDDLRSVADIFIALQEARHRADYDVAAMHSRADALKLVELAETGVRVWRQVRADEEATVFLTALLLAKKWAR